MIIERKKNEILVRLPSNVDLSELQSMLDYIDYKQHTVTTQASQEEVDQLAEAVNKNIWSLYKVHRAKK